MTFPNPAISTVVLYVYPVMGGDHDTYARRFSDSYRRFKPRTHHRLVVVSNGGDPTPIMKEVFKDLELSWLVHDDSGWDIGAYQKAAREIPCDLMVFFGGSSHIRGAGWLERMIASFEKHGEAIYGAMGSLGHNIHIRTTAFWMPPSLLNRYPHKVTSDRESRYDFEHGRKGLTMWVLSLGLKAWMVTWKGEFQNWQWDDIPNGFHQGDQSALLAWDRLADPPYHVPVVAQSHDPPGKTPAIFSELERLRATQATSLALVYVVRASSHTEPSHKFFTAYRKIQAGVAHDFVIAAVGFESEAATLTVKQTVWADIVPAPGIVLVPDPGFRLGIFREVCRRLSTKYVCLLGENSRPLTNGWLERLYSSATKPGVGIAGATASHQIDPHVRDNAFCIDRALFLELTEGVSAQDASALEASTSKSITRKVRQRGLGARVVGRTGDHDVEQAHTSHTFWLGDQRELLVADEQTDDYTNGSVQRRAALQAAAWPSSPPPSAAIHPRGRTQGRQATAPKPNPATTQASQSVPMRVGRTQGKKNRKRA